MPKPVPAETEAINADSFLDIVASVVSIMIIMVLMVGLRIKNGPVELPHDSPAAKTTGDLTAKLAAEQSLRCEILKTAGTIRQVQQEAMIRQRYRDDLALAVAMLERKLDPSRSPPGDPSPQQMEWSGKCRRQSCSWSKSIGRWSQPSGRRPRSSR